MNRIIYFTTALVASDYNALVNAKSLVPNPSNQIFHSKLIRALSLYNDLDIIVYRPLSKKVPYFSHIPYEKKKIGNVVFHYISFINHPLMRSLSFRNRAGFVISKLLSEKRDTLIMVDSLNVSLAKVASFVAKINHIKAVGIVTDDPRNLSQINKKYLTQIMSTFRNYDMFLTLTENLNTSFNSQNKPHYTVPGLVEEVKTPKMLSERKFLFFGGALFERYGVLNLISAFMAFEGDYDLIIAGQGPLVSQVREAAKKDSRIIYVGLLSPNEVTKYQKNASLNINPRPNNEEIDKNSIPSKMLDYMASGVPTLSVRNEELFSLAGDTVLWSPSGNSEDLLNSLEIFQKMDDGEKEKLALSAKKRVFDHYAIDIQGSKISYFIKSNK